MSFCCLFAILAEAETPFFWDEFDRSNLFESSLDYYDDPTPEERLTIVDGELLMEPLVDNFPALHVFLDQDVSEFRMETRFRFLDASAAINPFVFFAWRESGDYGDFAGIASDGRMIPGIDPGTFSKEAIIPNAMEILDSEINLIVEVANGQHTVTSWIEGTEPDPNFKLTENGTHAFTNAAIVAFNPSSSLEEDILFSHFAFLPLLEGDYSGNGELDIEDIDLLSDQLLRPDPDRFRVFDVNRDGITDKEDHGLLITDLFKIMPGDANLDGGVAFDDFLILSSNFGGVGGWADGDFDASGDVAFGDFLLLSSNFNTDSVSLSIPEPGGSSLHIVGSLILIACRSRKKTS